MFIIYDDKSHYSSTYNVLPENSHMLEEYIILIQLGEKI